MLRFMERNTYRVGAGFSKCNLNVDFVSSYIFAKYPHLTLIIQSIYNRAFGIIIATEAHYNFHSLIRCNTQLKEAILIFLSVISETSPEDFDL